MNTATTQSEITLMSREELEQRWKKIVASGSRYSPEAEELRRILREQGDRLYERFAKHLEVEHRGEYVAVHPSGEIIVAQEIPDLLQKAAEQWGDDDYLLRRFGHESLLEWKSYRCS